MKKNENENEISLCTLKYTLFLQPQNIPKNLDNYKTI